jgi:hypothetical protein
MIPIAATIRPQSAAIRGKLVAMIGSWRLT